MLRCRPEGAADELQIVTDDLGALGIRACVQERRTAGTIAGEREGSLPAGRALTR